MYTFTYSYSLSMGITNYHPLYTLRLVVCTHVCIYVPVLLFHFNIQCNVTRKTCVTS